jgi:hypothetical protein
MNNEVNLIANKKKSSAEKEKIIKIVSFSAYISLGVIIICAVVLFLLNQDPGFTELSKKEKATVAALSLQNQKIAKFLVIKSRLKEITGIINSRTSYDATISTLAQGMPSGISVDAFALTKQEVSMVVSSSSLTAINTYLSFMVDLLNSKKILKSISLNGVTADPKNNRYTLILSGKFL